jgi:hypothetical protein
VPLGDPPVPAIRVVSPAVRGSLAPSVIPDSRSPVRQRAVSTVPV